MSDAVLSFFQDLVWTRTKSSLSLSQSRTLSRNMEGLFQGNETVIGCSSIRHCCRLEIILCRPKWAKNFDWPDCYVLISGHNHGFVSD